MDMPITVELADFKSAGELVEKVYAYFNWVDQTFSTFKQTSEISKINHGLLDLNQASPEMKEIFKLAEITKQETHGYFNIKNPLGIFDPSGLVKGWAIYQASLLLKKEGVTDFYIDAGGDVQVFGQNFTREPWSVGIRNPFNRLEIVKVVYLKNNEGVATSGTYIRGDHIYNPHDFGEKPGQIVSLSVIGPNVYEADRMATAAFAMDSKGIEFIGELKGFAGYQIAKNGQAVFTDNFKQYTLK